MIPRIDSGGEYPPFDDIEFERVQVEAHESHIRTMHALDQCFGYISSMQQNIESLQSISLRQQHQMRPIEIFDPVIAFHNLIQLIQDTFYFIINLIRNIFLSFPHTQLRLTH